MSDTNKSATQNEDRKRRIAAHTRVALPLSLSKPRQIVTAPAKVIAQANGESKVQESNGVQEVETKVQSPLTRTSHNSDGDSGIPISGPHIQQTANGHVNGTITPSQPDVPKKPMQIRTELPPAFVPSSGMHTPQTASSGTPPNRNSQSFARPPSTHINFMSNDSGTSSPSPFSPHAHNPITQRHSPHPSALPFTTYSSGPSHQHSLSQRSNGVNQRLDDHYDMYDASEARYEQGLPFSPLGYPQPGHYNATLRSEIDSAMALKAYLASKFPLDAFTDVELTLYIARKGSSTNISGHKLIWARSPLLMKLMASQSSSQGRQQIRLDLSGKWADDRAMQEVIHTLYGGPLLAQSPINATIPGDNNDARLRYGLAYFAAGHCLNVDQVMQRSVDLMQGLLSWDVLATAIDFAYEDHGKHAVVFDMPSPLALEIAAFIINVLPFDFQLDTSAPDLQLHRLPEITNWTDDSPDGRPVVHRASRSINDPRLSRLRFGDLGAPTSSSIIISSVLISMPYALLVMVFDNPLFTQRLGIECVTNLEHLLVSVRETRRHKAKKQYRQAQNIDDDIIDNLHLEEYVEQDPNHSTGIRVLRRKEN